MVAMMYFWKVGLGQFLPYNQFLIVQTGTSSILAALAWVVALQSRLMARWNSSFLDGGGLFIGKFAEFVHRRFVVTSRRDPAGCRTPRPGCFQAFNGLSGLRQFGVGFLEQVVEL
jgi:hypothetical protein